MRVLFYGDLQINSAYPDYMECLEKTLGFLCETIECTDPAIIVNLGDFLDTFGLLDLKSLLFAKRWMDRIRDVTSARHILIVGNHDLGDTRQSENSLTLFEGTGRVVSKRAMVDDAEYFAYGSVTSLDGLDNRSTPRFRAGHLEWSGVQLTPTHVSTTGLSPTEYSQRFSVPFFNGHYHTPSRHGQVRMVGSPLFKDFGDDPSVPRGFLLYDLATLQEEFVENPHTYLVSTVRLASEADLGMLSTLSSRDKVKVYCPLRLVPQVEQYRDSVLWMGIYPTDTKVKGVEHRAKVNLTTPPEEVVLAVCADAPEAYDRFRLRQMGNTLFRV